MSSPLALSYFSVISPSTLASVKSELFALRTASLKVSVTVFDTETSMEPLGGSQVTVGRITSDVLKVAHCWIDWFPCSSATGSTHMKTSFSLAKSAVGVSVTTVFAALMVASMEISAPFASVSLNVMRASTLLFVMAELSIFRTGSLNVMVGIVATGTPVAAFTGKNVMVGGSISSTVKMAEVKSIALSASSSTT